MSAKLKYKVLMHNIEIDVELRDSITIIGGDSSTGKSYLKTTAERHYNSQGIRKVEVFDSTRPLDIKILRSLKGRLIFIDNADILLDGKTDVQQHINKDTENRYVLFMRSENGIDASINEYAELKISENKITLDYPYA